MFVALIVSYDGTDFHGYQIQRPGLRTIQGELQEALYRLTGHQVETQASGRTDAGVHAMGQIVTCFIPVQIPISRLHVAINARLTLEIRVLRAVEIPEKFHPRFDAHRKLYRYEVDISKTGNVFRRRFAYHYPYPFQINPMRVALEYLKGTHDFTSFCAAATPLENRVRTLYRLDLEECIADQTLYFWVEGNGFLWNMVRILVGTLFDVGKGKYSPDDIPLILEAKDRKRAGHTAPAQGLFLWQVQYTEEINSILLHTR